MLVGYFDPSLVFFFNVIQGDFKYKVLFLVEDFVGYAFEAFLSETEAIAYGPPLDKEEWFVIWKLVQYLFFDQRMRGHLSGQ